MMTVDLSTIPLVALSVETTQIISTLLNPPKVIPSENGVPRDWRGLAHLCDLGGEYMPLLTSHADPSAQIISILEKRKDKTIRDFQLILEEIDRWDILDDAATLFEKDAEKYLVHLKKSLTSAEALETEIDEKVLTVDDLHRFRQGLESQYYDAFLLYADEDCNFASEMINKLENQYNLKLCIKDRDLIGGVTFEHEAVMTLISERCNRLIVIVSSNFLKSPANKFFLNYAQALGIDKRQRKVIPCLYEKCQLPPQLSYMFILDYNRVGLYDFWGKLRDSVQTSRSLQQSSKSFSKLEPTYSLPEKGNSNIKTGTYECKLPVQDNSKSFDMIKTQLHDNVANNSETKPINQPESLKDVNSTMNLISEGENAKSSNKKSNALFQWTKQKLNRKTENNKKDYKPMSESLSVPNLPSLDALGTLSTSMESVEKKQKKNFINKCVNKVQLKKILVKS